MQPWQFLPVHPLLKQVIDTIIIMRMDDFSATELSASFYYPWSAQVSLFFTISQEKVLVKDKTEKDFKSYPVNFILGPNLVEREVKAPNKHHVLGITFRPGGLQRLCGIPVYETVNECIDGSILLGKELEELSERLCEAVSDDVMLNYIEVFFLKKLQFSQLLVGFDNAIFQQVRANGNISMDRLAEYACVSTRQLERLSKERLGMSPKLFARLTRFSKAYILKESSPQLNWTNIAHHCGYFDQMHLIRDFKTFSGTTPTFVESQLQNSVMAVATLQRSLVMED